MKQPRQLALRVATLGLPFGLLLLTACGGSDDKGGGGSGDVTSLPPSKSLGSLSDSESQQLCKDLASYYSSSAVAGDLQEFGCRFSGIFMAAFSGPTTDAEAQAACKMAYDECKAAPAEPNTTQTCDKPDASCTATVAEFEACTKDQAAAFSQAVNTFPSCSALKLADLMNMGSAGEPAMSPASCTTLEMKCPSAPSAPTPGG